MAREVDVDNLDEDQVRYLQERPWLIEEAKTLGVDDIEDRMREVQEKSDADAKAQVESGDYESLNLKQLRQLASDRQLDRSGNKAELVLRLKEDDEYQAKLQSSNE